MTCGASHGPPRAVPGHSRHVVVLPDESLDRQIGLRLRVGAHPHTLFGFEGGLQAILVLAVRFAAASEVVDQYDTTIRDDVVLVPCQEAGMP